MVCILYISDADFDSIMVGKTYEYIVRLNNMNFFCIVSVRHVWKDFGIILGDAKYLVDIEILPAVGNIIGASEDDLRGWILLGIEFAVPGEITP